MATKVLVTGANGFVGRAVCARLASQGCEVHAAVRTLADNLPTRRVTHIASLDRDTDWADSLADVDVVVHLAARVHVMQDKAQNPALEYQRTNVDGTLNLARQAASAGVKRLVFLSSVKVNGEATLLGKHFQETDIPAPEDAYGRSKCAAEDGLRLIAVQTGLEVVIIRPPLVYGPDVKANFARLLKAVRMGLPLPMGAVPNLRSLVGLSNLAHFIDLCTHHPTAANQTFLVSDGEDVSTTQLLRRMARACGVRSRLIPFPVAWLKCLGHLLGKGDELERLCGNLQVDVSKAKQLLGWQPPMSMDQELAATAAYQAPTN